MKAIAKLQMAEEKPRQILIDWVRQHQTALFFGLTFLFSWMIDWALSTTSFENETTYQRLLGVAAFSPSLSAIFIQRILNSKARETANTRRLPASRWILLSLMMFLLVAGVEWWNNAWWDHAYDASLVLVDAVLVTFAVIVLLGSTSNHAEPGSHLLGAKAGRTVLVWIITALIVWPALTLAGNTIASILHIPLSTQPSWPDQPLIPIVVQSFLWAVLFGGPLNEEMGWRGFALPRLQLRYSPLIASVIIGILWGLWHVPLHFMNAYGGGAFGAIIRIQEIPVAILFTWLYNLSKGSLLAMLLLHASINTTGWFLPRSYAILFLLCTLFAIILCIKDRMWERLPKEGSIE